MQLTPEQVNEFIAKSILDSQIGNVVTDAVRRTLGDLVKTYNNPFDAVIKQQVALLIEKEVKTQFTPQLEEGIKAAVAQYATAEVVGKIVDTAMEVLKRRGF